MGIAPLPSALSHSLPPFKSLEPRPQLLKMSRATKAILIAAFSFTPSISALEVTPGSSCASTCLDSTTGDAFDPAASTTNTSDIVCYDVDYYSTTAGVKFKDCLECLQTSTDVNGSESDVSWFICKSKSCPLRLVNVDASPDTVQRQPAVCFCCLSL